MGQDYVPPAITAHRFNCPHCGTYAHQSWYRTHSRFMKSSELPDVNKALSAWLKLQTKPDARDEEKQKMISAIGKLKDGFAVLSDETVNLNVQDLYNIHVSRCFSCDGLGIWRFDRLIDPQLGLEIEASADMPTAIIVDFNEARDVFHISPRASAALLRLCVQKLCAELGEKGRNIDEDIASLVRKGMSVQIQQALDVVRVVGNEAVHPE